MFPIRDDNPQILVPYATYAIVILNGLAWVFLQGLGMDPQLAKSLCHFALIPAEFLNNLDGPSQIRVSQSVACVLGDSSAWYAPVTSMFMHGSWMHIIGNMWFLWIFGNNVEDAMGHFRFIIFYLLCGLAAAALQTGLNPSSAVPMVGASGAIGGVMGAYILLYPRVHVHLLIFFGFFITTIAVPAVFMLGYWFVLQLLGGFTSLGAQGGGVAFWAHIGGFGAGAILMYLFRDKKLLERHPYHGWQQGPSSSRSWQRINRR